MSSFKHRYAIIIPNLNGEKQLSVLIPSLKNAIKTLPSELFEFILIDNNSHDHSKILFKHQLQKYNHRLIVNRQNNGFAKAVNQGVELAMSKYVVICNNDIVVSKNWFQIIDNVISKNKLPKIATYFGLVLNKDGTKIESSGLDYYLSGKAINRQNKQVYNSSNYPQNLSLIWGASASIVIYDKSIFQKLGGFDENFFAYIEDVDLSFRLQKHHYQSLFIPQAIALHDGQTTSNHFGNLRQQLVVQNWILLILKNYTFKQLTFNFPAICIERLRNYAALLKNTPFYLWPYYLFITNFNTLLRLPKVLKKRKVLN